LSTLPSVLQTQGFLAYAAAFAKPFSAPTAADLVGSTLAGPNMLSKPAQQAAFYAEMEQVSCWTS